MATQNVPSVEIQIYPHLAYRHVRITTKSASCRQSAARRCLSRKFRITWIRYYLWRKWEDSGVRKQRGAASRRRLETLVIANSRVICKSGCRFLSFFFLIASRGPQRCPRLHVSPPLTERADLAGSVVNSNDVGGIKCPSLLEPDTLCTQSQSTRRCPKNESANWMSLGNHQSQSPDDAAPLRRRAVRRPPVTDVSRSRQLSRGC